MTQLEKLVAKLRTARGDSSYADVRRLLEANGWRLHRQHGSHVIYVREPAEPINFPLIGGRHVRREYVKGIIRRLESEGALDG